MHIPILIIIAVAIGVWLLFRSVPENTQNEQTMRMSKMTGSRPSPSSSEQLDMAGEKKCPECGASWWPGALKCWQCDHDTRADDSDSS